MTNIALVVLDTVRRDIYEEYFDWLPGQYFPNAWSTSHRTPPVHASLFTGLYGSEAGVTPNSNSLTCNRPVLAELLSQEGYQTTGYSANPYISEHFNFDKGFSDFHTTWRLDLLSQDLFNWEEFAVEHKNDKVKKYISALIECVRSETKTLPSLRRGLEIKLRDLGVDVGPNDDGAQEILSFVEQTEFDKDEFLFLNLMEAHEPYGSPQHDSVANTFPTTVELTFKNHNHTSEEVYDEYKKSVEYLSEMYRKIFSSLKDDFDVIITCSDHGELFNKNGLWGHFHGVDPELCNVPLQIYQGNESYSTINDSVSLLDVYTTILKLADIEKDFGRGSNLLTQDFEPSNRLVECRGISEERVNQVKHDAEAVTKTTKFEKQLYGASIPPNSYAYEHINGFELLGEVSQEEGKQIINNLVSELDASIDDNETIPTDVQEHLKDLGYV